MYRSRSNTVTNSDSWRSNQSAQPKINVNQYPSSSSLFTVCRDMIKQTLAEELQKRRDELDRIYSGQGPDQGQGQTQGCIVNYDDPLTHCTYLRTDVPYRALCLTRILEDKIPELNHKLRFHHKIRQMFEERIRLNREQQKQQPLSVVSIGCGPGTDLLAVLQFCVNSNFDPSLSIRFDLCDRSAAWKNVTRLCSFLCKDAQSGHRKYGQYLDAAYFHLFDLTDPTPKFEFNWKADLFTMSMVLSEVTRGAMSSTEKQLEFVRENLWLILKRAKVGAYFVFVDMQDYRGDDVVRGLLNSVFERSVKTDTDQVKPVSTVIREFSFGLSEEERADGEETMRHYFPKSTKSKSKGIGAVVVYLYQKLGEIVNNDDHGHDCSKGQFGNEKKQKNRKAKEWNAKGLELMRQDSYEQAEEAFEKAVDGCTDENKNKKNFHLNYEWAKAKKVATNNNSCYD